MQNSIVLHRTGGMLVKLLLNLIKLFSFFGASKFGAFLWKLSKSKQSFYNSDI